MKMKLTSFPILSQLFLPMIEKKKHDFQVKEIAISKFRFGKFETCDDFVAAEQPLQIKVNQKPISITMRSPGDDVALALGFLLTEGLIASYPEIVDVIQEDENSVNVMTETDSSITLHKPTRNFLSNSSCGVCGKITIDDIKTKSRYMPITHHLMVKAVTLLTLQEQLLNVQQSFEMTGGIHACALFSLDSEYLYHSEDVGRHNALDKLIGHALMADRLPLDRHILLLSGRASFELLQKASMAGIPIVVAVGAPSSLAIELALENEMTLVGFLKKTGFNVYSGSHRIE